MNNVTGITEYAEDVEERINRKKNGFQTKVELDLSNVIFREESRIQESKEILFNETVKILLMRLIKENHSKQEVIRILDVNILEAFKNTGLNDGYASLGIELLNDLIKK